MRRLLLAFAVAGGLAFMAIPAKADSWGIGVGYYNDDYRRHSRHYGHYWNDGTWYRGKPYVRSYDAYYDPCCRPYYYNRGWSVRYGSPWYYRHHNHWHRNRWYHRHGWW